MNQEIDLLKKNIRELLMIETISKMDKLSMGLDELVFVIMSSVVREIEADFGLFLQSENGKTAIQGSCGLDKKTKNSWENTDRFLLEDAIKTNRPLLIGNLTDVRNRPKYEYEYLMRTCRTRAESAVIYPIISEGKPLGGLEFFSREKKNAFNRDHLRLISIVAMQIAVTLKERGYLEQILRQSETESRLRRFFPDDVFSQIKEGKISLETKGVLRPISVLFMDIRNFSGYAEKMKPRQVVNFLNNCFSRMVEIINDHKGVVDKFIGDAIFAFWGAPVSYEDSELLAARAAIKMQQAINELVRDELVPQGFGVGIGINYGEAIIGNVGSSKRLEYTAIGDSVNITARLCRMAAKTEIVVSEDFAQRLNGEFNLNPRGNVEIKGREKKLNVFQLNSALICPKKVCL